MNKYNRAAINYFGEKTNRNYLKNKLINYFRQGEYAGYPNTSKICEDYICKTFDKHMYNFIQQVEKDFMYSMPVTERYPSDQNPGDQVACLNMKFTEHMIDLIEGDLLNWERRQQYVSGGATVNDGLNASSKTIVGHAPRSVLRDKDTRIVDDPMFHFSTGSAVWGGSSVGGYNSNSGEKSSIGSIKPASIPNNVLNAPDQPANFNSSKWVESFKSVPAKTSANSLTSTTSNTWQSAAIQVPDRASREYDDYDKGCEIKSFKFSRANKLQPLQNVTKSADAEVNKWWYPTSAVACIRDDPVGEINRDRGTQTYGVRQRNQIEFPYGNASAWRGDSVIQNSVHSLRQANPNESIAFPSGSVVMDYSGVKNQSQNLLTKQPLYSAVPSAKGFIFDEDEPSRNVISEGFANKSNGNDNGIKPTSFELPRRTQGNSLCSYSPANISVSSGHSFSGVIDPTELGNDHGRFTGDAPEFSGNHVDRLLGMPYIQTLNVQYGDPQRQQAVSSCFERGKYGAKMLAGKPDSEFSGARPQNSVMFWEIGDGFVDQKNDAAMERLQSRRIFRSFNRGCDTTGSKNPHGNSASDQIPWFERALYNRYYERDVEESVGGFELDNLSRGYGKDMMSLYCRVPNKNLNPESCGKTKPPYPAGNREIPLPSGYNQTTYENSKKVYPDWAFYSPK